MKSRAWIFEGSPILKLRPVELPQLKGEEVLVKIRAIGLCATDLHILTNRVSFAPPPYALGHEASGEALEIGPLVTRVKVGDRCALDPSIGCGLCHLCLSGRKHHCSEAKERGIDRPGFWQEHVIIHQDNLYLLPDALSFREGSQCETLHVCLGGMEKLGLKKDERVAIVGDGPLGLLFLQLCKQRGASHVALIGGKEKGMELARELGCDQVVSFRDPSLFERVAPKSFHKVIEAVGTESSAQLSQKLARSQGRILLMGLPHHFIEMDIFDLVTRELEIVSSTNAPLVWPEVIELLSKGEIVVSSLITHVFPYHKLADAISWALSHGEESVKIVIENHTP